MKESQMNEQDIIGQMEKLEDEMRDISQQMNEMPGAREYSPGEPVIMGSFTDLIRLSILRKRLEIAEFEHANWQTVKATGKRPDHFDERIADLQHGIKKDQSDLDRFS